MMRPWLGHQGREKLAYYLLFTNQMNLVLDIGYTDVTLPVTESIRVMCSW